MAKRSVPFVEGEYYHIYNRGVEKRDIFCDTRDLRRFLKCLQVLNTTENLGSLHQYSYQEKKENNQLRRKASKLVEIVCFALLPNHYHLLLQEKIEDGIPLFMHKLGTAHSKYFNDKYDRSGGLFQGKFKSIHVGTNEYLLRLSAYINLNIDVHRKWQGKKNTFMYTSFPEYTGNSKLKLCNTSIILDQFSNRDDYRVFAEHTLQDILYRRQKDAEELLNSYLLE